jgi:adenylosuccinate lyase
MAEPETIMLDEPAGGVNPALIDRIAADPEFRLSREEIEETLDPARHAGRAAQQVDDFLRDEVAPRLAETDAARAPELRV